MFKYKQIKKTGNVGHLLKVHLSYNGGTIQYNFAHRYISLLFIPLLKTGIDLIGCNRGTVV